MANEEGVTNLGRVPSGMTFAQATAASRPLRKHRINPYERVARLTLCDTLRMMWREVDALPDGPLRDQLRDYLGACFDYGKRMDARMKELKAMLDAA